MTSQKSKQEQDFDFMPHWKDEEKCFEEAKLEFKDKNGKKIFKPWHRDKPTSQIVYEEWMEKVVNPSKNEYHPARDQVI